MGRLLLWTAVVLFVVIGIAAMAKGRKNADSQVVVLNESAEIAPVQIEFIEEPAVIEETVTTFFEPPKNVEDPITNSWPTPAVISEIPRKCTVVSARMNRMPLGAC